MKKAISIINDLLASIREPSIPGELMARITAFKREADIVEDVGSYERGQIVNFNPDARQFMNYRAKVMRAYGTANGKVFYDLALSFVDGHGVETFAETVPIRDVSPAYVHGLSQHGIQTANEKDIPHLNFDTAQQAGKDTTFSLPA